MKIFTASDHGGYKLRKVIIGYLRDLKKDVEDLGTDSEESVDFPDFARKLCSKIIKGKSCGILICGTGIGMSIAANKYKGIRAALCSDVYSARMSREHNDANVLCLGGRVIGEELAKEIVKVWLESKFSGDKRHKRRLKKIGSKIVNS